MKQNKKFRRKLKIMKRLIIASLIVFFVFNLAHTYSILNNIYVGILTFYIVDKILRYPL